ncbi:MAG: hypothetical protein KBD12_00160 [Candidatus Pacebacteria bacterium]|nr:hypothetical protein [Candidatus Paceibacterota bacterium]
MNPVKNSTMIKKWSSRWTDTSIYKTKEIILSVVGSRVRDLKPSNKACTYYVCTCPFHKEKTPSFNLYYNKFLKGWGYKCLGCGTSGDVFTFLMKLDRCEFWDVLKFIKKNFTKQNPKYFPCSFSSLRYTQLEIPFPPC